MRVAIPTLDFDDGERRAIRAQLGRAGKATRDECVGFVESCVANALDELDDDELDDDDLLGAEYVLDGLERHYLQNPADQLDDDEDEEDEDEIAGIPNADFEELEDELRIVDGWF